MSRLPPGDRCALRSVCKPYLSSRRAGSCPGFHAKLLTLMPGPSLFSHRLHPLLLPLSHFSRQRVIFRGTSLPPVCSSELDFPCTEAWTQDSQTLRFGCLPRGDSSGPDVGESMAGKEVQVSFASWFFLLLVLEKCFLG